MGTSHTKFVMNCCRSWVGTIVSLHLNGRRLQPSSWEHVKIVPSATARAILSALLCLSAASLCLSAITRLLFSDSNILRYLGGSESAESDLSYSGGSRLKVVRLAKFVVSDALATAAARMQRNRISNCISCEALRPARGRGVPVPGQPRPFSCLQLSARPLLVPFPSLPANSD